MYQKAFEIIKKSKKPLSTKEISKKVNLTLFQTKRNLQRLQEEGKIESVVISQKICWKLRERDEKAEKLERRIR
ncbi:MAG: FaeA/PapI family transcriptional regulator [Candidatus Methanofastidiosia archaeon]